MRNYRKTTADEPIVLTAAELEKMARGVETGENERDSTRGTERPPGLDGGEEGSTEPARLRGRGATAESDPSDLPKQALVTWCGGCGAHFEVDFLLRCPVCGWRIPR